MAAQYQVNIAIQAGTDFCQTFYLAEPDKTPLDITGAKFIGALAKHPGAFDANLSTSDNMVYKMWPFITRVVDGQGGAYSISLPADVTKELEEGKYVYNVVTDMGGVRTEVVTGLAFVTLSFGSLLS